MGTGWMDVTDVPFDAVLLLERVQLGWLPGWIGGSLPREQLSLAFSANPKAAWFVRHKCPEIADWLEAVIAEAPNDASPEEVRAAELEILRTIDDLLVYVLEPRLYDAQPFLGWDSAELTGLMDFTGRTVIDVGAGTGRLAFAVAEAGAWPVFAVEPVGNLRDYVRAKAGERGIRDFYAVDGTITSIPFPAEFADVVMGGHVFGDEPTEELAEMLRVTRPGGMVILCPGNNDVDNDVHAFLVEWGAQWGRFEEPVDGIKRKYWIHKGDGHGMRAGRGA